MDTLEERLAKISQETKINAETEAKNAEEQALQPVRDNIKDLEAKKYRLDIIKGSLDIKSGEGTGKGMKESSVESESKLEAESKNLDALMLKYKDAVEALGINNRDQFLENEQFADAPEVVEYKQAKEKAEIVQTSDGSLEKKLSELGINMEPGDFNYTNAENLLSEKIAEIDNELLTEKLKTPEGREEAVELATEKLEKMVLSVSVSKETLNKNYSLTLRDKSGIGGIGLSIDDSKARFKRPEEAYKVLPQGLDAIEETYGKEIAEAALRKAYDKKVEAAFKSYDKATDNIVELKQSMEGNGSKERREALDAFQELQGNNEKLGEEAKEKIMTLWESAKEFRIADATDVARTMFSKSRIQELNGVFERGNDDKFPPAYDWKKVLAKVEEIKSAQNNFLESLNSLNTPEDIKDFFDWDNEQNNNKSIAYHNRAAYETLRYDLGFKLPADYQKLDEYKRKYPTNDKFREFLNEKSETLSQNEAKAKEAINLAIDVGLKSKEFQTALEANNFRATTNFDSEVRSVETNKQDAKELLNDLASLEVSLANEELVLNGRFIRIVSEQKKWQKLGDEITTKKELISDLDAKISKYPAEPAIFGKSQWREGLKKLNDEKAKLSGEIEDIGNKRKAMYPNMQREIKVDNYTFRTWMESQPEQRGNAQQVFAKLREKLGEYTDRTIPDSLLRTAKELRDSTEKLSK